MTTHAEPAILEPIVYDRITDENGKVVGYRPPASDRRRFERGSGYAGTGSMVFRPTEPDDTARPLDDILAELEAWSIGDERLHGQLIALYSIKPLVADRIAAAAVAGAQNGSLHDPSAYLASRLRPKK